MIEAEHLEEFYNPMRKNFTRTTGLADNGSGKIVGTQRPANRALRTSDIEDHLAGTGPMVGLYQSVDEKRVGYAGLDVDDYDVNVRQVCAKLDRYDLPLVPSRTKSGGLHLDLVSSEPLNAADVRVKLRQWGEALGLKKFEVFPKNDITKNLGAALQLPMYGILSDKPLTYYYDRDGEPILDLQESLNLIDAARSKKLVSPPLPDGPPCLQRHALDKVFDGDGRDVVLFNAAVFAKMLRGNSQDEIKDELDDFNQRYIEPPKSQQVVGAKAKSVANDDFSYQCKEEPLARFCDQELCRKRDYGIGGGRPAGSVEIPSDHYSFSECAEDIFERFAEEKSLFRRGEDIVQIIDERRLESMKPSAFQSRIEKLGSIVKRKRSTKGNKLFYGGALLPPQHAQVLLDAEAKMKLPEIKLVSRVPLLHDDGSVMEPGYNADAEVLVISDLVPTMMSFEEATDVLLDLFADFNFYSDGDKARAISQPITAMLRMSGLLRFPVPVDLSEAIESQSGKTLRQAMVRAIFDAHVPVSADRDKNGGKAIGALDDNIALQFYRGEPFIVIDNYKGDYDSEYVEAAVSSPNQEVMVRIMRRDEFPVDISRQMLQFSSNNMQMSEDMLNRTLTSTIRKQPDDYEFKFGGVDAMLSHIREERAKYLGACLSIGAHAIQNIEPDYSAYGHDFRDWFARVNPIIRAMGLPSLNAHAEEKKDRLRGKRGGQWLLHLVSKMEEGHWFRTRYLIDQVLLAEGIDWPNGKNPENEQAENALFGTQMKYAFRRAAEPGDEDEIAVGEFTLRRRCFEEQDKKGRTKKVIEYMRGDDACSY